MRTPLLLRSLPVLLALGIACPGRAGATATPETKPEMFETPHLQGDNVDAVARSTRTRMQRGAPAFKLENAVCNFKTDAAATLVFDWPAVAFFSQGGGAVPAKTCKVLTRVGVVDTDLDDQANILLTTQKTPFAATTWRRKRDRTVKVLDWVSTSVGMRPVSPGPAANGSNVDITTYFHGTRAEHYVEGGNQGSSLYIALPKLSGQALESLAKQLQQQSQTQNGARVGTRQEVLQDLCSAVDLEKANQFLGGEVTHLVKLRNPQKVQLVWETRSTAGQPVAWIDLPVLVTDDGRVTGGLSYASPDPGE